MSPRRVLGRGVEGFFNRLENSAKLVALLKFELLRSERLSKAYPGGLNELRAAYDLFDLGLRAVSPYVVFC